jgi:hypothetical protein
MADEAVVIGGGPGGLRAALALAGAGRRVTLLQEGPWPGGHAHPDIPIGRGLSLDPGAAGSAWGAFQATSDLARGVWVKGRTWNLPLSRADVARLLPVGRLPNAASAWARTRGAVELRKVIGGGSEQRTYRDWIVQRFGEPVFELLFEAYCEARFGPPDEVSCNVARRVHAVPDTEPLVAPTAGPSLSTSGIDVRTAVVVKGVSSGRVDTEDGAFEGDVFVDVAPARVVDWLGHAASVELRNDVAFLHARDALEVLVRCPQELPYETHVLGGAPFYRVTRPGRLPGCGALDGHLCVHYALPMGDPLLVASDEEVAARTVAALEAVGIRGASAEGARVQRVRDHHPSWTGTHLVRMRRYLLALEDLEITPVGRAGLHAPLDLTGEAAWIAAALSENPPTLRARARALVEPPVLDPTERTHLTRLIER